MLFVLFLLCQTAVDSIEWNKHHDNEEILKILKDISLQCPNISAVYNLKYHHHGIEESHTVNNNLLPVIVFGKSPLRDTPGIPNFKYVGNMHGDEVVSREVLLHLISYLCHMYTIKNPKIVKLITLTRIHILPSMNPDGWEIATDAVDLKINHKTIGRNNAFDVDLNRNFPEFTNRLKMNILNGGPIDHLKPERFQIENVQPETLMVMEWANDVNFVLSANLHGGDLVANYPYDDYILGSHGLSKTPDHDLFVELAESYSSKHPRMHAGIKNCGPDNQIFDDGIVNGAEWYPIGGSLQDYNYLATNDFEITIELGCQKYPPASELTNYWNENRDSLVNFIMQIHRGVSGQVFSIISNHPIEGAIIKVTNTKDPDHLVPILHDIHTGRLGEYHRLLTKGTYIIVVQAQGFQYADTCVTIGDPPSIDKELKPALQHDFYLTPEGYPDEDTRYHALRMNKRATAMSKACQIVMQKLRKSLHSVPEHY